MTDIIERIRISRNCDRAQASRILSEECDDLSALHALGALRPEHIDAVCANLGIEPDYKRYFINILLFNQS